LPSGPVTIPAGVDDAPSGVRNSVIFAPPPGVGVAVGVGVEVGFDVGVVVGTGVAVGAGVAVGVGVALGADVGVAVDVGFAVGVGVAVGALLGVAVAVGCGLGVGDGDGTVDGVDAAPGLNGRGTVPVCPGPQAASAADALKNRTAFRPNERCMVHSSDERWPVADDTQAAALRVVEETLQLRGAVR